MLLKVSIIEDIMKIIYESNKKSLKNIDKIRKDILEGFYNSESHEVDHDHETKRKTKEETNLRKLEKTHDKSDVGSSSKKKKIVKGLARKERSDNEDDDVRSSKKSKNTSLDDVSNIKKIKSQKEKLSEEILMREKSVIDKYNIEIQKEKLELSSQKKKWEQEREKMIEERKQIANEKDEMTNKNNEMKKNMALMLQENNKMKAEHIRMLEENNRIMKNNSECIDDKKEMNKGEFNLKASRSSEGVDNDSEDEDLEESGKQDDVVEGQIN